MSFMEKLVRKQEKPYAASEVIPTSVDFKAIAERYQHPQDFVQGLQYEIGKTRKAFTDTYATKIALHGTKEWNTYRESTKEIERLLTEYSKNADVQAYEALESEIEKMNASMGALRSPEKKHNLKKEDGSDGWEREDKVGKGIFLDSASGDFLTHAEKRELLRKAMQGLNPENPVPQLTARDSEEELLLTKDLIIPDGGISDTKEKIVTEPEVEALSTAEQTVTDIQSTERVFGKTAEVEPREREALNKAEKEYLGQYTAFHMRKKIWNLKAPKTLTELETTYNEARLAYARALENSVDERLGDIAQMPRGKEKKWADMDNVEQDAYKEKVKARYNRLVRFNEVIKPTAEKKLQARAEALSGKEQGILGKAFSWVGRKNSELEERFGKNGARAVRALTTTVLLAPIAFSGAGALAFAGWGSFRIAKALAGGAGATAIGTWFERTRGKKDQEAALFQLQSAGRDSHSLDLGVLKGIDTTRESLQRSASEKTLQRNKAIVQVLSAYGIGAGTAELVSNWESLSHIVATTSLNGETGNAHEASTLSGKIDYIKAGAPEHLEPSPETASAEQAPPISKPEVQDLGGINKPTVSVGPSPAPIDLTNANHPTIEHLEERTSIHIEVSRGEGADKLLSDLQEQLRSQYGDVKTAPENVQALLNHGPHRTAELLGLGHESGGVMLHPGDTLGVDDQGRLVFHDNIHDRDRIIIDEKHELHPLKGHAIKAHVTETHKAHATHEHVQHPVQHPRSTIETSAGKADADAVARANRVELLREQKGQFQPASFTHNTSVEGEAPKGTTLGDLQPSTETPSVRDAAFIPATPEAGNGAPLEVPNTGTKKVTLLGDFSKEIPLAEPTVITNHFGLAIDTKIPHVYVTENNHIDVYGGSGNAPRLIAEQYAKAHPGVEVRFQASAPDAFGNPILYTGEITANEAGELFVHIPNSETEELLTPPDPETFTEIKS